MTIAKDLVGSCRYLVRGSNTFSSVTDVRNEKTSVTSVVSVDIRMYRLRNRGTVNPRYSGDIERKVVAIIKRQSGLVEQKITLKDKRKLEIK
jgi:hypothetical protein